MCKNVHAHQKKTHFIENYLQEKYRLPNPLTHERPQTKTLFSSERFLFTISETQGQNGGRLKPSFYATNPNL